MPRAILLALVLLPIAAIAQSSTSDEALLAKTRALYDTPFLRGLVSFDCAVDFDFQQHVANNFGTVAATSNPMIDLLSSIHYRVFVDRTGATVSAQPKLPDLSVFPRATEIEESNRQLIQTGLTNWIPHAYGEVLPLGSTQYHFDKTSNGYQLSMQGTNLDALLSLDNQLNLVSGVVEKPMHIEMTTDYTQGPNGLILASATTNTNHLGTVKYAYTYQMVDGFQIPSAITLTSPQNVTLHYSLSDCKTQHGIVVKVGPPVQH